MRNIFFIATLIAIIFSCSKEPVLNIREGMTFDPDTLMLDSSMQGWELYTWQSGEAWKFSLMPGTSRIKKSTEILSNPYIVTGREQLKLLIRQLSSGEEITWLGTDWITNNVEGVVTMYKMPPLLTQYDIHSFSKRKSISVAIIP